MIQQLKTTTAMRKFTKTTMAVLAILAGTVLSASAREGASGKVVKVTPETGQRFKLTYLNEGKCNVVVKILNETGTEVFSERIQTGKSFVKPYNFEGMDKGDYTFKVIDAEGAVSKMIKLSPSVETGPVSARVDKVDGGKFQVTVLGVKSSPVYVNIYDHKGARIFGDYIDRSGSFSKTYDLSKLGTKGVSFEVVQNSDVIASTMF